MTAKIMMSDRIRKINKIKENIKRYAATDHVVTYLQQLNMLCNLSESDIPEYARWTGCNENEIADFCGGLLTKYSISTDAETNEPVLNLILNGWLCIELGVGDILCKEDGQIRTATYEEVKLIINNLDVNTNTGCNQIHKLRSGYNICSKKDKNTISHYVKWDGENYIEMFDFFKYFYKIQNWKNKNKEFVFYDKQYSTDVFSVPLGSYVVLTSNPAWGFTGEGPVYLVEILNETEMNDRYIKQ